MNKIERFDIYESKAGTRGLVVGFDKVAIVAHYNRKTGEFVGNFQHRLDGSHMCGSTKFDLILPTPEEEMSVVSYSANETVEYYDTSGKLVCTRVHDLNRWVTDYLSNFRESMSEKGETK